MCLRACMRVYARICVCARARMCVCVASLLSPSVSFPLPRSRSCASSRWPRLSPHQPRSMFPLLPPHRLLLPLHCRPVSFTAPAGLANVYGTTDIPSQVRDPCLGVGQCGCAGGCARPGDHVWEQRGRGAAMWRARATRRPVSHTLTLTPTSHTRTPRSPAGHFYFSQRPPHVRVLHSRPGSPRGRRAAGPHDKVRPSVGYLASVHAALAPSQPLSVCSSFLEFPSWNVEDGIYYLAQVLLIDNLGAPVSQSVQRQCCASATCRPPPRPSLSLHRPAGVVHGPGSCAARHRH